MKSEITKELGETMGKSGGDVHTRTECKHLMIYLQDEFDVICKMKGCDIKTHVYHETR